jgi:DNA-binding FadR family transcriptional regulator
LGPSVAYAARSVGALLQHRRTSVADVWDARSLLECDAVEILAGHHRVADVRTLRATAARIRSLLDQPAAFATGALDFHEELVRLSRNTTLHVLTLALHEIVAAEMELSRQRSSAEAVRTGNLRATRTQNKLVDLIAAGEVSAATDLWRRHMAAIGDVVLRTIGPASVIDIVD